MKVTLKLAAETYATLNDRFKDYKEVLKAIQNGDKTTEKNVILLMLAFGKVGSNKNV